MSNADINDRSSIERIYPRAVFLRECNANMRTKASMLRGLSILVGADAAGRFEMVRAARRASAAEAGDGVFLYPVAAATSDAAAAADPYHAFLDRVIATAAARHSDATARGDARRKGLRP
jgi:hypothetical protein